MYYWFQSGWAGTYKRNDRVLSHVLRHITRPLFADRLFLFTKELESSIG